MDNVTVMVGQDADNGSWWYRVVDPTAAPVNLLLAEGHSIADEAQATEQAAAAAARQFVVVAAPTVYVVSAADAVALSAGTFPVDSVVSVAVTE